jgi:hypothetical protein
MNVVKLLGEDSLVAMNAIRMCAYVPLNFINFSNWHLSFITINFHSHFF